MNSSSNPSLQGGAFTYVITARFSCQGRLYAEETYRLTACDEPEAERIGHHRAIESDFCDPRIRDFRLALSVTLEMDPDDDPPSAPSGASAPRQPDSASFE